MGAALWDDVRAGWSVCVWAAPANKCSTAAPWLSLVQRGAGQGPAVAGLWDIAVARRLQSSGQDPGRWGGCRRQVTAAPTAAAAAAAAAATTTTTLVR